MTWVRWRRVRQVVQGLALALFVYLLFAALPRRSAFSLADLYFRLDPLAALASMAASREWIPRLALALALVGLTLVAGRVWCGWLCPLGTLLEWVRFPSSRLRAANLAPQLRVIKNVLLLTLMVAAILGNLSLLVFDPLTLLTRTMTTAILPGVNHAITATEKTLYPISFLQPVLDPIDGLLRTFVLPAEQPVFDQNLFILALFIVIFALNLIATRFWCRYLCPLGALLGLVSKVSLFRPFVDTACTRCARCTRACQLDAIDTRQDYAIVPSECTVCLDCMATCPQREIAFRLTGRPDPRREYDPTRRQILTAMAVSAVGVVALRTGVQAKQPASLLIRPPGIKDEPAFLARCLRCSQCMRVCPTAGLQPALFEAGLEGLWTPRLIPRLGYCDYGCNACGQVCPSGAIPSLELPTKRQAILGLAVIDRNRCLPWARGVPCIVCEEMCPTPEKAIWLEKAEMPNGKGEPVTVQRPHVLQDRCIGCGICEHQCPIEGEAAIRVYRA